MDNNGRQRDDGQQEDEGWVHVGKRKEGSGLNDFHKVMKNISKSFLFTKFPEQWGVKDLWSMFQKYGLVIDVYIAKKRTVVGDRFGFVRFKNVGDVVTLEKRLSTITFGSIKLVINVAKYTKTDPGRSKVHPTSRRNGGMDRVAVVNNIDGRSYVEAFKGLKKEDTSGKHRKDEAVEVIISSREEDIARLSRCLVGDVKDFDTLQNIWNILKGEGWGECKIRYLGGLSVLLEWPTCEAATEAMKTGASWIYNWMTDLKPWSAESPSIRRLVWIRIEGIPAHVWREDVVESIARTFGRVLDIDGVSEDSLQINSARALILTKCIVEINRKVKTEVDKLNVWVRVTEDPIRPMVVDTTKQNDSDDNDSVSDLH